MINDPPKTTKTTTKSQEWSFNQLINLCCQSYVENIGDVLLFASKINWREKLNYSNKINNLDPNLVL